MSVLTATPCLPWSCKLGMWFPMVALQDVWRRGSWLWMVFGDDTANLCLLPFWTSCCPTQVTTFPSVSGSVECLQLDSCYSILCLEFESERWNISRTRVAQLILQNFGNGFWPNSISYCLEAELLKIKCSLQMMRYLLAGEKDYLCFWWQGADVFWWFWNRSDWMLSKTVCGIPWQQEISNDTVFFVQLSVRLSLRLWNLDDGFVCCCSVCWNLNDHHVLKSRFRKC